MKKQELITKPALFFHEEQKIWIPNPTLYSAIDLNKLLFPLSLPQRNIIYKTSMWEFLWNWTSGFSTFCSQLSNSTIKGWVKARKKVKYIAFWFLKNVAFLPTIDPDLVLYWIYDDNEWLHSHSHSWTFIKRISQVLLKTAHSLICFPFY